MIRSVEELVEIAGRENAFGRKMLMRLNAGMTTPHEAQNSMARYLKKTKGIIIDELGPFPEPDYGVLAGGEIFFARDRGPGDRRICLLPSLCNIAVLGPANAGKTNALLKLGHGYITSGIAKVKTMDSLGNFTRLSDCCRNTVSLEVPALNIMASPGIPVQRWINVLLDLIAFHSATLSGGRNFMNRTHSELGRMFEGSSEFLCLGDLTAYMGWLLEKRKLNQTDRQYCERIVGKLVSWEAELGDAFFCQRGVLETVEECNQVIVLRGLSDELQRFCSGVLILRDFLERLFNPEKRARPLVYMIDEARDIFPQGDERAGPRSTILSVLTQVRNAGIYWVVATQEPSKLAHVCLSNSQTKIVFGITEGLDLAVVQQSLRLNPEQVREIARFGESGLAVVKFAKGYTEPFTANIELFDECVRTEIAEDNRRIAEEAMKTVVPRSQLLERVLFAREREREGKYGKMSAPAKRLLEAFGREPYKSLTDLYETCGLGSKGSTAKKDLAMAGLIHEQDMAVKTRKGAARYLLSPTEKGRNWLKEVGISPAIKSKGGQREIYYSLAIERWAQEKGFTVRREYRGADLVLVSKDGEKVAVEIACRKENQVSNIQRDLQTKIFTKIVVACENGKVQKEVESEYKASGVAADGCEVVFLQVTELMP
ncbi:MAG: hypothetical protein AB1512_02935 [Thermodesulfobacteriota bacterium]